MKLWTSAKFQQCLHQNIPERGESLVGLRRIVGDDSILSMAADLHFTITLLGVLCMGIFVGFILGWTLVSSASLTVKIAASVISAALAGAPIMFMRDLTFERWMYTIGLLLGLAWTRMFSARNEKHSKKKHIRTFAWIDMIAIIGATIVVFLCSALAWWFAKDNFLNLH